MTSSRLIDDRSAPKAPAWGVSLLFHTALFALLLLFLAPREPRGAAEQAGRDVGIVLRRDDADGDPYEGEEDSEQPSDSVTGESNSDLLSMLPDASAAASAAEFLPQGLGPDSAVAVGDAGQMTQGGGGSRPSASGGEAVVQVFGVEGVGTKFVYAFDRSVSMNMEGRLSAAKRQLIESLDSLESIHQFQIIFFNSSTTTPDLSGGQRRVAFATDQNKVLAERFVSGVIADGGTDRFTALSKALALGPDVIFFLTDADDPMSAADLQEIQQSNRRIGATICTIEFGSGPSHGRNNFLKQLATMTGGQYGYVDTRRLTR